MKVAAVRPPIWAKHCSVQDCSVRDCSVRDRSVEIGGPDSASKPPVPVPVMGVREMGVRVRQGLVDMPVRMRLTCVRPWRMLMLMMAVVRVAV